MIAWGYIAKMPPITGTIQSSHLAQDTPMASGKILVAQGGGPTAVINQSLVGVALEARRFGQIGHIYGALHGVDDG